MAAKKTKIGNFVQPVFNHPAFAKQKTPNFIQIYDPTYWGKAISVKQFFLTVAKRIQYSSHSGIGAYRDTKNRSQQRTTADESKVLTLTPQGPGRMRASNDVGQRRPVTEQSQRKICRGRHFRYTFRIRAAAICHEPSHYLASMQKCRGVPRIIA